jgi:hypothetical protein
MSAVTLLIVEVLKRVYQDSLDVFGDAGYDLS